MAGENRNNAEEILRAPPGPRANRELTTLKSIRNEMVAVYREMKDGTRTANDGKALVYALTQLAEFAKGANLEKMLSRLERRENTTGDFSGGLRAD